MYDVTMYIIIKGAAPVLFIQVKPFNPYTHKFL